MIDHDAIRRTLRTKLVTTTGITAPMCVWENVDFTPPTDGSIWIREQLMPIHKQKVANELEELLAVVAYDFFYPVGKGSETVERLVDAALVVFTPPLDLNTFSVRVNVHRSERMSGKPDGIWFMIPCHIYFRAFG
jgi:hypothetical protein